jgi:ketosteroid isomerase-like protein
VTTLAALTDWLDRYEQAWRNNDAEQIRGLFTDDAMYRWNPWDDEGAEGSEDIIASWLEQPDDPDDWTLDCEAIAVEGDLGVARCVTRYRATARGPERVFHNIWLVTLTDDGRCSDYVEYYMKEPTEEPA